MTSQEFWLDFLSNFLSDILAGGVIGALLAWFVGLRLGRLERSEEQKDTKIGEKNRAIQYLTLLGKEIEELIDRLPVELEKFSETGWGREIQIDTPFWDSIDRSGELPRLLHPNMVRCLTQYYGHIAFARRGRDLLIETWLIPDPHNVPGINLKTDAFIQMTINGLRSAIYMNQKILQHVKDNILVLQEEVKQLEEDKRENAL
jgi:hypothetical protein